MSFRTWICALAAMVLCASPRADAHGDMGLLETPIDLTNITLRLHDGTETTLHDVTKGKITALQMIFTTCNSVCPIQGAIFGAVAEDLEQNKAVPFQLLSISIDAQFDNPEDLATWRAKYYDGQNWLVAVSDFVSTYKFVDQLLTTEYGHLLDENPVPQKEGERPSESDHHTSIVMFIGPDSKVVYRTLRYPEPDTIRAIASDIRSSLN